MFQSKKDSLNPGNLQKLGYSQYAISTEGQITNVSNGRILKPFVDRRGYENYSLWGDGGKRMTMRAHQLVAKTFIPNPNNYPQVDHLDGNKRNNSVSNLEWVDNGTNARRAFANGQMHPHLYKREDAIAVCEELERGTSMRDIEFIYGYPKDFVFNVRHRVSWRAISDFYTFWRK